MNARRSRLLENEEWLNVILSWSSLYLTLSSIKIQTHNLFISDQLRLLFKMLINKLRKLRKRLLKAHKKITFVFRCKFGSTVVNFFYASLLYLSDYESNFLTDSFWSKKAERGSNFSELSFILPNDTIQKLFSSQQSRKIQPPKICANSL